MASRKQSAPRELSGPVAAAIVAGVVALIGIAGYFYISRYGATPTPPPMPGTPEAARLGYSGPAPPPMPFSGAGGGAQPAAPAGPLDVPGGGPRLEIPPGAQPSR